MYSNRNGWVLFFPPFFTDNRKSFRNSSKRIRALSYPLQERPGYLIRKHSAVFSTFVHVAFRQSHRCRTRRVLMQFIHSRSPSRNQCHEKATRGHYLWFPYPLDNGFLQSFAKPYKKAEKSPTPSSANSKNCSEEQQKKKEQILTYVG